MEFSGTVKTVRAYTVWDMVYSAGLILDGILNERGVPVLSGRPYGVPRRVAIVVLVSDVEYPSD